MSIIVNGIRNTTQTLDTIKPTTNNTFADVLQREIGHNIGCGWKCGRITFPTEEEAVEYQREMED